jgi:hypothetical protein
MFQEEAMMRSMRAFALLAGAALVAGAVACEVDAPETAALAAAVTSEEVDDLCGQGPPPGMPFPMPGPIRLPPPPEVPQCEAIEIPDGAIADHDADSSGDLGLDELALLDRDLRGALSGPMPLPPPPPGLAGASDVDAAPQPPPGEPPREVLDLIRRRLGDLLAAYDDGSGALGADELERLLADLRAGCEARRARAIEHLDTDGDGVVSEDELAAAREQFQQALDELRSRAPERPDAATLRERIRAGC